VQFHGYGAEHDRQLLRPGAFEETCLAVRRAREAGLEIGANVFLTKPTLAEIDRLLAVLVERRLARASTCRTRADGATRRCGRSSATS
jgi:MoaA/NifB/PqqE/SkfB family radical SAM enzyme